MYFLTIIMFFFSVFWFIQNTRGCQRVFRLMLMFCKPSVRCTWRRISTDFQTIMSGGSFTLRELPCFHPWLSYEGRFVDKWPHPPSPRSLTHWLTPTPHVKDSCSDEICRNWRRSAWQFALPSWNYPSESGECLVEGDAKQRKYLMGRMF